MLSFGKENSIPVTPLGKPSNGGRVFGTKKPLFTNGKPRLTSGRTVLAGKNTNIHKSNATSAIVVHEDTAEDDKVIYAPETLGAASQATPTLKSALQTPPGMLLSTLQQRTKRLTSSPQVTHTETPEDDIEYMPPCAPTSPLANLGLDEYAMDWSTIDVWRPTRVGAKRESTVKSNMTPTSAVNSCSSVLSLDSSASLTPSCVTPTVPTSKFSVFQHHEGLDDATTAAAAAVNAADSLTSPKSLKVGRSLHSTSPTARPPFLDDTFPPPSTPATVQRPRSSSLRPGIPHATHAVRSRYVRRSTPAYSSSAHSHTPTNTSRSAPYRPSRRVAPTRARSTLAAPMDPWAMDIGLL
ncbi:securin [Schizosaccharomyces japonicus yFS275]|uniref:Securin n=1 Tax=Schizosaccharomyces japonicus (strain yFS275 / FY16936) TaxID=402676 RepID=B6JVP5_SCHJY|nr:securin [Schizosaccharomyces japonicus yFS275]EEB05446.1 securin [Schizosaccharomyces japonicus yFS275]